MHKQKYISSFVSLILLLQFITNLFWPHSVQAATNPNFKVVTGANQAQTAVAISQAQYSYADTAIVVSTENYSHALSIAPLAYALRSPILYTSKTSLPAETLAELKRLRVQRIILIGSPSVIEASVESVLKSVAAVRRIGERTAEETAVSTANELVAKVGNNHQAFLVSSSSYSGAIIAGSFAARNRVPILLTGKSAIPPSTLAYLNQKGITKITLVGNTGEIDGIVDTQLRAKGIAVTRIESNNRSATSAKFARTFFSTVQTAFTASGWSYAEVLAAAPYAAKYNAPLLLINKDTLDAGVASYLTNYGTWRLFFINRGTLVSAANQINLEKLVAPQTLSIRIKNSDGSYRTKTVQGRFNIYYSKKAFDLQNKHRVANGQTALLWDDNYFSAAKIRSAELSLFFSHTRPDGSTYSTINAALPFRGENAACGYFTPQDVTNTWKKSIGHNLNMLKSTHRKGAVACIIINQQIFWISMFGG